MLPILTLLQHSRILWNLVWVVYASILATPLHLSRAFFVHLLDSSSCWYSRDLYLLQTYLQSLTIRLEEMRVKRRDSEQWMHHRLLPQDLRERVRRYDQYKWLETRGVDEESLVQSLPKDLRRDIKRHLCLALVKRVIFLSRLICFLLMLKGIGINICNIFCDVTFLHKEHIQCVSGQPHWYTMRT